MFGFLQVALGGAIGASLRHGVNVGFARFLDAGGAWATLFVNVAGSLAMGLLLGWLGARQGGGESWWLFLGTGVFGGFTTFSAFSRETAHMIQSGDLVRAGGYAGVSVAASVAALMAGLVLWRRALA